MAAKHVLADKDQPYIIPEEDEASEEVEVKSKEKKDPNDDSEVDESEEGSAETAPCYPQVCAECHHAWLENRYRDVGGHRVLKNEGFKDEDCLLWHFVHDGPSTDADRQYVTTAVDNMDLPQGSPEKEQMGLVVGENDHKDELDEKIESEGEGDESIERNNVNFETTALDLRDDEEDVSPPKTDMYDFNGFQLYTPADKPLEIHSARINPETKIHMPLIESWLRTCKDDHPNCNKPKFTTAAEPKARFLLIDVVDQQIVAKSLSTPFVALSYVWGGAEQLQLTKALFSELTRHQGLMKYQDKISATIKDAMLVVSGLNERYLWVDCLCIVQDGTLDKQVQINHMAEIYDASILTIVACTATSANDRLPGVQPGTRQIKDQVTRLNGILFAREEHSMLAWTLPRVSHSARAWTFQEVILSRRCLYFLDGEIMMQCQKSLFRESTARVSDHQMMNQTGNWPPLTNLISSKFFRYREIVHTYSPRKLTFPQDRKNAFTGAVKAMELAWNWKFWYCMPASEDFDWALLWTGEYSTDKDEQWKEKQIEMSRSSGFPTWSWLSAVGRAWYLNEKESAGQLKPLIDWSHTTVWDGVKAYDFLTDKSNGMEPLVEGYPPGTIIIMGWVKHLSHATQSTSEPSAAVKEEMDKQASYGASCAPLIDGNGNWCGTINGITRDQLLQLLAEDEAELSLVLLSSIQKTWVMGGFRKSSAPYDVETFQEGEFKTVNVMLVTWNERLATRVGVGEMHIEAWKDKGPEPEGDLIRLI